MTVERNVRCHTARSRLWFNVDISTTRTWNVTEVVQLLFRMRTEVYSPYDSRGRIIKARSMTNSHRVPPARNFANNTIRRDKLVEYRCKIKSPVCWREYADLKSGKRPYHCSPFILFFSFTWLDPLLRLACYFRPSFSPSFLRKTSAEAYHWEYCRISLFVYRIKQISTDE